MADNTLHTGAQTAVATLRLASGDQPGRLLFAARAILESMPLNLPVQLDRAKGGQPGGLELPGGVRIGKEQLAGVFESLSLARELSAGKRDRLGRFDETALNRDISKPWVDCLARDLAGRMSAPGLAGAAAAANRFSVIITHDVDRTTTVEPFSILNSLLSAAGVRRSQWWSLRTALSPRAVLTACERLLDFEKSRGVGACFFMMSGPFGFGRHSTRTDIRWRSSREMARLIQQAGMNIGLHGSYGAREDDSYQWEKERLEQVIGMRVRMHRNHYLRFSPEKLYHQMEGAGIEYDFSCGFVSRIGFRAGSARAHRGFDWSRDRESKVRSVPLVFMDTMFADREPTDWLRELRAVLLEARSVAGCVSLLFHPEEVLIHPAGWSVFTRVIDLCQELGADLSGCLPAERPGECREDGQRTTSN
jgi:hypothetical protein